jgi:D-alanyl-lipoteichoic acid acyltransferase DltB (MBOAT superfamily)
MGTFFSWETIKSLLTYDPTKPLLFTQFYFWGFFVIVLAIYAFVYKRTAVRNFYLLLASFFFYYKTGGIFVILLAFTVVSIYYITNWLHKQPDGLKRKLILSLGVIVNLFVLFYFKYAAFIVNSINDFFGTDLHVVNHFSLAFNSVFNTDFVTDKIILPVGISFFTFQAISYCVDVYRRQIEPVKSVLDFGFYVSFFPQLVAGPIVRASEFVPQIYKPYNLTKQEFGMALFMILKGLIKKIFISDYISINFIDRVFDSPMKYSGYETLMSLYGYSLQVYTDFSGYTDIAIGLALLLGFRLSINFNSPYKAKSTAEFWRRWHISLSTWLKDYLYIPIGGNRNGSTGGYICWVVILLVITMLSSSLLVGGILFGIMAVLAIIAYFNPNFKLTLTTSMNNFITMWLGGLWHGSSWMFVTWGAYNGIGLVIYKLWRKETQVLRWIFFFVLNLAAYITYDQNLWHNPNGLVLWAIADFVWFYAYFVWVVKQSEKDLKALKYTLAFILTAFFSLCATVITGFWQSDAKYISWIILTVCASAVFYFADNYEKFFPKKNDKETENLPLTIFFWSDFIISLGFCFLGYTSTFFLIWLLGASIMLAARLYYITKSQIKEPQKFITYIWGIFLTFNFITFTRIWFRAPDIETTNQILERLLNGWDVSLIATMTMSYKKVFIVILFGMMVHWLSQNFKDKYTNWFINTSVWVKILICVAIVFVLYQVKASDLQPFIYFQF